MIAGAQFTIVDLNDPIQQGTAPSEPAEGMLWLDTSSSPSKLKRYNGIAWEEVGDSGAGAEALEVVQQLQAANDIVVGTQTSATASWAGRTQLSALKDGQQITYWLPTGATSSSVTLNLTLKDGTTTGAVPVYYGGTTRITTHYSAGNVIHLTYRTNVTIGTTTIERGWWADANYDSNTYDRVRMNGSVKAKVDIGSARIIVGDDNGYAALAASEAFSISKPILWGASAISAGSTGSNNYISYPNCSLRNNKAGYTTTAQKTCYIIGTLEDETFTPTEDLFTTDIPEEENGLVYIALGLMTMTYQIYLYPEHPMYMFVDGAFKNLNQVAYEAQLVASSAQITSTENSANIAALKTQITMTVKQTDYNADQQAVESRMTQIEQTASSFKVEVTKTITDQVATVSGDVQAVQQDLSKFQTTVQGYMSFDGDQLTLGKTGNSFKTQITNTEMAFTENNEKVAYISNSDMHITRARVTDTLSVGTTANGYFDFVTMAGGLALKWRNGS